MTFTVFEDVHEAHRRETLVQADDHPVDTDGFYFDRFIPGDMVETCPHLDPEDTRRCMDCEPA